MNNLATTRPQSATRYSDVTSKTVEHWAIELRGEGAVGVAVPSEWRDRLRTAQAEVTASLAPAGKRDTEKVLMALRTSTVTRNETADEAQASFATMRDQLASVPLDILRKACHRYTIAPGTRFFPRSAGELLAFVNPLLFDRRNAAHRLGLLAQAAEETARDEARHAGDDGQYTLDELRVFSRDLWPGLLKRGWATQAQLDQLEAEQAAK